jgi:hypothetical protein
MLASLVAACAGAAPVPSTAASPAETSAPQDAAANAQSIEAARLTPVTNDASSDAVGAALPDAAIATADGAPSPPSSSTSEAPAGEADGGGASASACSEQPPQDFLIRGNFLKEPKGNERAIQWRTDTYGYFKGYGKPARDAKPATASVVATTFMGLQVRMHRKVVPALACVEQEIKVSCADHPYTPHVLAGIRYRNTYRGGEVTNHAFGIAIDVDPAINTCCGCVPPWNDAPACHKAVKSEYERMSMPECWVHAFERYGFYWLGHDVLKDTMHFEFLGDPDRIVRAPTSPPSGSP